MLKLAYDFSRRALTTFRGAPIASAEDRAACRWQDDDLAPLGHPVIAANELDRLSESMLARAGEFKHSRGRGFQEHLQGVAGVLQRWGQDAITIQLGLLHSAYSTQQYPYGLYTYHQRQQLQEAIGVDAERLTFLFCSHDRVDLYAQAVALCRAGQRLPPDGLTIRNALTGERHQIPPSVIAHLLMVHAADLAEQMDGFSFEIIFALLSVSGGELRLPACHTVLEAAGFTGTQLTLEIEPARGTFGLAPVLGLSRSMLSDRVLLARLLRGQGALSEAQSSALGALDQRRPGLVEVPWIRFLRDGAGAPQKADDWLLEARARYGAWGVTWLKRPFDGNETFDRLIRTDASAQA